MTDQDISRLYEALGRIENRQNDLSKYAQDLSTRVDTRVDKVEQRVEQLLAEHKESLDDSIDEVSQQVVQLAAKTGAELGRMRAAVMTVEKSKSLFASLASGAVFDKYRYLIIIIVLILGAVFGFGFISYVGHLLTGTPSEITRTITTHAAATKP